MSSRFVHVTTLPGFTLIDLGVKEKDFEQDALPHLNSAYNLARWLSRNDQDADDIVQEAYLRAFKSYRSFRGGDARPWLLKIVRNTYYTSSQKKSAHHLIDFDDDLIVTDPCLPNPEEVVIQKSSVVLIRKALEMLSTRSREMLTLREMEGLFYKEISTVMEVPTGTVMSTLSHAHARLRQLIAGLTNAQARGSTRELNVCGMFECWHAALQAPSAPNLRPTSESGNRFYAPSQSGGACSDLVQICCAAC